MFLFVVSALGGKVWIKSKIPVTICVLSTVYDNVDTNIHYNQKYKKTVMQIEIPVKLFVLPAIYDNVDAGIDHK